MFVRACLKRFTFTPSLRVSEASGTRSYRSGFDNRNRYQNFGRQQSAHLLQRWINRPYFYEEVGLAFTGLSIFYIYNRETVAVSGRQRFNVVPVSVLNSMSQDAADEVLARYRGKVLDVDDPKHRQVQRVLQRLVPHSGLSDQDWSIHVIDEPGVKNAFVLPGGKVFIFVDMLDICKDDDGIASVLGHEIAHNVANHAGERLSQSVVLLAVGYFATSQLGIDFGIGRMLLDLAFARPGSRKHESEADYIGLVMMAQSCYRPEAAVELWHRLAKEETNATPEFLETHPASRNRAKTLEEWLPKAKDVFNASECSETSGYLQGFNEINEHMEDFGM